MQLQIRFLGVEMLHIELTESSSEDPTRDLSGGYLGSVPIEAGKTDIYLGFTNGRESADDEEQT